MERGSTGPEEKEVERLVEEEATASSPLVVEPREERHEARLPTPTRQVTPPEREEKAIMEIAESRTLEAPGAEMEVDTATTQ